MDFPIITYSYELHDLRKRESAKKQLLDSKRPIPISILNRLKQDFTVEWTYNSNSIEGNTLTITETELILEDGITVGAERSLNIFISSIGGDYEDYLPTSVIAGDPEVKYGQEYLSLLARIGMIDAYKDDRVCLTKSLPYRHINRRN